MDAVFAWYHPGKAVHHVFFAKMVGFKFASGKEDDAPANGCWLLQEEKRPGSRMKLLMCHYAAVTKRVEISNET